MPNEKDTKTKSMWNQNGSGERGDFDRLGSF